MALSLDHPEIFVPPPSPPTCCVQASITVPPSVNAKTTPKHDYPSAAHRRSYGRRTAVERAYASLKDRATTNIDRGWCRLMGLVPITLFLAAAVISRNWRIIDAFDARRAAEARGQLPRSRSRRRQRQSLNDLIEPTPS